jgi:uncharacterized protein
MISKKLHQLDECLLKIDSDDAMLLSELDGFIAGLIVGPELIMPSEWLAAVWGSDEPMFEDETQVQTVIGLIMEHYNNTIRDIERGKYRPLYDADTMDESIMWETWIEGFWRAVQLRPDEWLDFSADGNPDLQKEIFILTRLYEIASTPTKDLAPLEIDTDLSKHAPDLIPVAVEALHKIRLKKANQDAHPGSTPPMTPKVGRNDLCPCGSGKKFKKCCLN